ncbi:MAG: HK97 family phage prohead protease [Holosporales bacterium]|jgi:HK97 family phage prohead protease|nr:HK97 family phage prohead protease [Holosporales bacterium]
MQFLDNKFQIKAFGTEPGTFEGYASVFGNIDYHREIVAKGAFTRSLRRWKEQEQLPKMLWQHDQTSPIGVWEEMYEDDYGLFVRGRILLDIQKGKDVYALLKSKVVDGLSIGFQTKIAHQDGECRVLDDVDLFEVSLVTFMANPSAKVTACKQRWWTQSYDQTIYLMDRLKSLRNAMLRADLCMDSLALGR